MPQWRKLWTKTTESLDLNDMPDDFHRLLWLMLPLVVCREGRGLDNPAWIKSKAMPLRMDVSAEQVGRAMDWYARRGMVQRYEADHRSYFAIRNWDRYQGNTMRESPSDYPAPPSCEGDTSLQEQVTTNSRPTQELLTTNSGTDADADAYTDTEKESEKPGADAPTDFGPATPATYNDWLALLRDAKKNEAIGILTRMACTLYPEKLTLDDQGIYARIGKLAKDAGSTSKLANLLWDNARRALVDPLDYISAAIRNDKTGGGTRKDDAPARPRTVSRAADDDYDYSKAVRSLPPRDKNHTEGSNGNEGTD